MGIRKTNEPLRRTTINLFDRDIPRLVELYPTTPWQVIVRNLVRAHVTKSDRKVSEAASDLADEIEFEESNDAELATDPEVGARA